MQKDQLSELVDRVNILWRSDATLADRKEMKRVWWSFLHDLDFGKCHELIDTMNMSGDWAPRPGEIRKRILLKDIPTWIECWNEMRQRYQAIQSGSWYDERIEVSELTLAIIEKLGEEGARMHTNGDRSEFKSIYDSVVSSWLEEK